MIAASPLPCDDRRPTPQRLAVLAAFEEMGRPLAVGEVLELGRRVVPRLGIATVYRHLRELVDGGQLTLVSLPGGVVRYELAGLAGHHHFQCSRCDRVYDIHGAILGVEQLLPKLFRLERQELILHGRCADCEADA
ncbi:MAG: transcriptional repressor [Gemmatimonadales bacterium]|nr:transcriptional repressor [Gemmatimonadales bacterium]